MARPSDFVRVSEFARILRLDRAEVRRRRAAGTLPEPDISSPLPLWSRDEAEAFAAADRARRVARLRAEIARIEA